jgi:hypothetical protein
MHLMYRNECYSNCINDNFPNLTCYKENLTLTYYGNKYNTLYFYPRTNNSKFNECLNYIDENPSIPFSLKEPDRQWKVHTCFKPCSATGDCLMGFEDDNR